MWLWVGTLMPVSGVISMLYLLFTMWLSAPEEFRYQHTLHLAGTFTNLVNFDAAPVARNRKFIHEAVTAMNLYGLVGSTLGHLGSKEFGHRCFSPIRPALHMQPGSLIIH